MSVTVYSKPNCVQCSMTIKVLKSSGIEYVVVDVTEDDDASDFVIELGYLAAPVVYVSPERHWSGFKPELVRALGVVTAA